MIKSIHIENYALIEHLDIDLHSGFSVITGETGAGKSIILGAIGLLLGQRADSKSIKNGKAKCVVEAGFMIEDYGLESFFEENDIDFDGSECIIRRELTSAGKSRAFINDTPAQLGLLKELGDKLIDVHSQHQNLLLNKENFQLNVLDIIAGNADRNAHYSSVFMRYTALCSMLDNAIEEAQGINTLMSECALTQEAVAERLGRSRSAVANLLRLLNLPRKIQAAVVDGSISAGHARVLAGIAEREQQANLFAKTLQFGWSVRQLEEAAKKSPEKKEKPRPAPLPAEYEELSERLRHATGLKVTMEGTQQKGKIVLSYSGEEELQRLWDLLEQ